MQSLGPKQMFKIIFRWLAPRWRETSSGQLLNFHGGTWCSFSHCSGARNFEQGLEWAHAGDEARAFNTRWTNSVAASVALNTCWTNSTLYHPKNWRWLAPLELFLGPIIIISFNLNLSTVEIGSHDKIRNLSLAFATECFQSANWLLPVCPTFLGSCWPATWIGTTVPCNTKNFGPNRSSCPGQFSVHRSSPPLCAEKKHFISERDLELPRLQTLQRPDARKLLLYTRSGATPTYCPTQSFFNSCGWRSRTLLRWVSPVTWTAHFHANTLSTFISNLYCARGCRSLYSTINCSQSKFRTWLNFCNFVLISELRSLARLACWASGKCKTDQGL